MGRIRKSLIGLAIWLLLLPVCVPVASGHPHVFIENTLTLIFDKKGLAGIHVTWVFDEFFSNMIACDYDTNRNSKLEASEVKNIKEKAFSNLKNFDYFTFIRIDKRPFKVKYVREFSAELKGGKLIYRFLIPCHVKAVTGYKQFIISQYDPTYYTSVFFAEDNPVSLKGASGFDAGYHIEKNLKKSFYYGQFHPLEVVLEFRKKNG
jgi:ABC-type uncharacterized transport system substrate-binding protein